MFGSFRSSVQLLCDQTSLGTYSLMFTNCSVFCDVRHVQSLVLGQNVMCESIRSLVLLFVTRLVSEHTVWCSWTVQFFVMFNMFKVRFWAKMWCSESSMFWHSMFGVFEVRYFGVRSKTNVYQQNSPNLGYFVVSLALLPILHTT